MPANKPTAKGERWSVGIGVTSQSLAVSDMDQVVALLDSSWETPRVKELHPRLRSGVNGERGVALHVHLLDSNPARASENLLRAVSVLNSLELEQVRSRDGQVFAKVDVEQHIRNRGVATPVALTADSIRALSGTHHAGEIGLDIDQYRADGPAIPDSIVMRLVPKRGLVTQRIRLVVKLVDSRGESPTFAVELDEWQEDEGLVVQLGARIDDWRDSLNDDVNIVSVHSTLEQAIPLYTEVGPALGVSTETLGLLTRLGSDLTIRTRIGPAIVFRAY